MKKTILIMAGLLLLTSLFAQKAPAACSQDYDDGYAEGYAEGYAAGYKAAYEAGKKSTEKSSKQTKKTEPVKKQKVLLPEDPNLSYMVNLLNGKIFDKEDNAPEVEKFDKEYYIIFYGGEWCPYCKKESPLLKEWYKEQKAKYDNFEIILAGSNRDKSNADLKKFMQSQEFSFFYVDYDYQEECKFFSIDTYTKAEKFYVPAYILMDKDGNVLSSTNLAKKEDYDVHRPLEEYVKIMESKKN